MTPVSPRSPPRPTPDSDACQHLATGPTKAHHINRRYRRRGRTSAVGVKLLCADVSEGL
jgi:hypothetical protein